MFLLLLTLACALVVDMPKSNDPPVNDLSEESTAESVPTPTPLATEDVRCVRLYTDDSIWNTPIDWSVARIHSDSDAMMGAFFAGSHWIGSDPTQYAPNIYLVDNSTPLVPVRLKYRFRDAYDDVTIRYGDPGGVVWMPLPEGAQPAPGSDGQLAVINLDTGEEWGLNGGRIEADGRWSARGAYRYSIYNSGIPPEGFGQRGAGIGQAAGIVRRCEVERGAIEHAVTLAYDSPCTPETCARNGWPAVIPPFRKTDGRGTAPYDIPEGARLVIRPEISEEEILAACRGVTGCVLWARAMQTYGGFIVDHSGHPKTYAEGDATAHWPSDLWSASMLRHIPREWYAVLDWNIPATSTP
ncbi:MAG: hypothetical protein D6770_02255 [Anaerolineae bacterium]|nr:MAG: hypothetical protein D6770_02255 [Anaerolineae bacterium]